MKKVLVGLAIIIIIGAGAYFLITPKGATAPEPAVQTTPVASNSTSQSLGALVATGAPVTCTFSTTTENGTTNGTMYIANGMVAGDFTTQTPQTGPINAHILVRDATSYMWTSTSNQGFKSTVSATSTPAKGMSVGYNTPMSYTCQPWTIDSSKFTLPTNISFMSTASYTAPPQGAGATGAAPTAGIKGTAAQCAQCGSLPGAAKAQCLSALQCQ